MVEECVKCSRKHLLASESFIQEAEASDDVERRKEKLLDAFKNIQAAEEHVSEKHPKIAREIRAIKKRLEPSLDTGDTTIHVSDLRMIVKKLGGKCEDCDEMEEALEDLEEEKDTGSKPEDEASSSDMALFGIGILAILGIGYAVSRRLRR